MIKACIFDLDGTLANTLESMAYVANHIMRGFGLKELPVENFRYYCGEGANMLMRRCLKDAGDPELTRFEEGQRMYREMFAEDPMYKVTHYEGMLETLAELKRRGKKLAVCSNKPHPAAVKVIGIMFPGIFDTVLGQSEKVPRKPSPVGPQMIAKELGAAPSECVYIGDTRTDMLTGKAAGMFTVGALWGFRTREELIAGGADLLAGCPAQLLDICERD